MVDIDVAEILNQLPVENKSLVKRLLWLFGEFNEQTRTPAEAQLLVASFSQLLFNVNQPDYAQMVQSTGFGSSLAEGSRDKRDRLFGIVSSDSPIVMLSKRELLTSSLLYAIMESASAISERLYDRPVPVLLDDEQLIHRVHRTRIATYGAESCLYLTTYRIILQLPSLEEVSIPIMAIKSAEMLSVSKKKRSRIVSLTTKDCRCFLLEFESPLFAIMFWDIFVSTITPKKDAGKWFAFRHKPLYPVSHSLGWGLYTVEDEFERLGLLKTAASGTAANSGSLSSISGASGRDSGATPTFRLSKINAAYDVPTLPHMWVVPSQLDDSEIRRMFPSRLRQRVPMLIWGKPSAGRLLRADEPDLANLTDSKEAKAINKPGADLRLMDAFAAGCAGKVIVDLGASRTYKYAYSDTRWNITFLDVPSNRTLSEYYATFLADVENADRATNPSHSTLGSTVSSANLNAASSANIRGSLANSTNSTSINNADEVAPSQWTATLQMVLGTASSIGNMISYLNECVLLQHSPNSDLDFVISSLAQVMIDGHYRTINGLGTLLEKDWCSYGYDWSRKLGHSAILYLDESSENIVSNPSSTSSISPTTPDQSPCIDLFIEALWQLTLQFPMHFEYTESFLIFLLDAIYSGRFGTFLLNSEKERDAHVREKTTSIWAHINFNIQRCNDELEFVNYFYDPDTVFAMLDPRYEYASLKVWYSKLLSQRQHAEMIAINQLVEEVCYTASSQAAGGESSTEETISDANTQPPSSAANTGNLSSKEGSSTELRIIRVEGGSSSGLSPSGSLVSLVKHHAQGLAPSSSVPNIISSSSNLSVNAAGNSSATFSRYGTAASTFSTTKDRKSVSPRALGYTSDRMPSRGLQQSSSSSDVFHSPEGSASDVSRSDSKEQPMSCSTSVSDVLSTTAMHSRYRQTEYEVPPVVELDLSSRGLKLIPHSLCMEKHATKIQALDFSNNKLNFFPSDILRLTQLRRLNLSGNPLGSISRDHFFMMGARMVQLQQLDLSHTNIAYLPDDISTMKYLRILIIKDNFLEELPPNISSLARLEVLDARNNRLKSVPKSIFRLQHLKFLSLGENAIAMADEPPSTPGPASFGTVRGSDQRPPHLRTASNMSDSMSSRPKAVSTATAVAWSFKNLVRLEFLDWRANAQNAQHPVPISIYTLPVAKTLHLQENFLESLPPEIGKMTSLTSLNISRNQLSSLPDEICGLTNLKILNASFNNLSSIPARLYALPLTTLNLSHNRLKEVPTCVLYMAQLSILNLGHNSLQLIPTALPDNLINLSALILSDNQISSLDNLPGLGTLTKLELLHLQGNYFERVPIELHRLEGSLKELRVDTSSHTRITFPPKDVLSKGTALILRYLSERATMGETDSRLNIIFIGEMASQKHTLLQKLIRPATSSKGKDTSTQSAPMLAAGAMGRGTVTGLSSIFTAGTTLTLTNSNFPSGAATPVLDRHRTSFSHTSPIPTLDKYEWTITANVDGTGSSKLEGSGGSGLGGSHSYSHRDIEELRMGSFRQNSTSTLRQLNSEVHSIVWEINMPVDATRSFLHPSFLNDRSFYVITWENAHTKDDLHSWIEIVTSRSKRAQFLVVGFQKGDPVTKEFLTSFDVEFSKKYGSAYRGFVCLPATSKFEIKGLQSKLEESIWDMPIARETHPASYYSMERFLLSVDVQPPLLTYSEFERVAKYSCGIKDMRKLIRHLMSLGIILYLADSPLLEQYILLDPLWPFAFLSQLSAHARTSIRANGVISHEALLNAAKPDKMTFPEPCVPTLVAFQQALGLIFPLVIKTPQLEQNLGLTPTEAPVSPEEFITPKEMVRVTHAPSSVDDPVLARLHMLFNDPSTLRAPFMSARVFPTLYAWIPSFCEETKTTIMSKWWPRSIPSNFPHPMLQCARKYTFASNPNMLYNRLISRMLSLAKVECIYRTSCLLVNAPTAAHNADSAQTIGPAEMIHISISKASKSLKIQVRTMIGVSTVTDVFEAVEWLIRDMKFTPTSVQVSCPHCLDEKASKPHYWSLEEVETASILPGSVLYCHDMRPISTKYIAPELSISNIATGRHIAMNEIELLKLIGEGAAAEVFLGEYHGELVAVKRLRGLKASLFGGGASASDIMVSNENTASKALAEFRREIRFMSRFKHTSIVGLKGIILDPPCIVTEFCDGGNLFEYCHPPSRMSARSRNDSPRPLPVVTDPTSVFATFPVNWSVRLKIALDIAEGMALLHSHVPSVSHRDLKSPNILLQLSSGRHKVQRDKNSVITVSGVSKSPSTPSLKDHIPISSSSGSVGVDYLAMSSSSVPVTITGGRMSDDSNPSVPSSPMPIKKSQSVISTKTNASSTESLMSSGGASPPRTPITERSRQQQNIEGGLSSSSKESKRKSAVRHKRVPSNLEERLNRWTAQDSVAKITDFGLTGLTPVVAGREVDNPVWLAPEVMIRGVDYGEPADVYSYAVILYELLTNREYFGHMSFMTDIEKAILSGQRPILPLPATNANTGGSSGTATRTGGSPGHGGSSKPSTSAAVTSSAPPKLSAAASLISASTSQISTPAPRLGTAVPRGTDGEALNPQTQSAPHLRGLGVAGHALQSLSPTGSSTNLRAPMGYGGIPANDHLSTYPEDLWRVPEFIHLMYHCLAVDPSERPTFLEIIEALKYIAMLHPEYSNHIRFPSANDQMIHTVNNYVNVVPSGSMTVDLVPETQNLEYLGVGEAVSSMSFIDGHIWIGFSTGTVTCYYVAPPRNVINAGVSNTGSDESRSLDDGQAPGSTGSIPNNIASPPQTRASTAGSIGSISSLAAASTGAVTGTFTTSTPPTADPLNEELIPTLLGTYRHHKSAVVAIGAFNGNACSMSADRQVTCWSWPKEPKSGLKAPILTNMDSLDETPVSFVTVGGISSSSGSSSSPGFNLPSPGGALALNTASGTPASSATSPTPLGLAGSLNNSGNSLATMGGTSMASLNLGSMGSSSGSAGPATPTISEQMIVTMKNGTLRLFDSAVGKWKEKKIGSSSSSHAYSVVYLPRLHQYWVGGDRKVVRLDASLKPMDSLIVGDVQIISMLRVDTFVWLGCSDGSIRILSKLNGSLHRTLHAHSDEVTCLLLVGNQIWSAGKDRSIIIWNIATLQIMKEIKRAHNEPITTLCLIHGREVWSGSADKRIARWSISNSALRVLAGPALLERLSQSALERPATLGDEDYSTENPETSSVDGSAVSHADSDVTSASNTTHPGGPSPTYANRRRKHSSVADLSESSDALTRASSSSSLANQKY